MRLTSAAMEAGHLSYSKARAVTRVADADSEAALLEFARALSAEKLVKVL